MADEFVDFYEALNLPLEAERTEVRKRINEVYLEAQRNLDHRNFQTRVKYQEMFEVVLPRARYILLDDGRRDEYDRLVRAFRGASSPSGATQAPASTTALEEKDFGRGDASGFRLAEIEEAAGKAPPVEALPKNPLDQAQMAVQRDEMWAKWKQGLEAAIARDEAEPKPTKPAPARTVTPTTPSQEPPASTPSPANVQSEPQRKQRSQAASISFNFEGSSNGASAEEEAEEARVRAIEIEQKKIERKRAVMKEILDSVGLKGTIMGALGAGLPAGALLVLFMTRYYPREGAPQLSLPAPLAWFIGAFIVLAVAFFAGNEMSKSMRKQTSMELSMLSLEDLLRRVGRSY